MAAVPQTAGIGLALAILVLAGCGGGSSSTSSSTKIGANTDCDTFLSMSGEDGERAIELMQKDQGKGTSGREIAQARDKALDLCQGEGSSGAINDIYDDSSPTATAAAEPSGAFKPEATFVQEEESQEGATTRLTLEVGPVPTSAGSDVTLVACEFDSQRDVVVPARVTVKNMTQGFSVSPSVALRFQLPDSASSELMPLVDSKPTGCSAGDGFGGTGHAPNLGSFSELASDEERSADFALVLKDYFTPATPDGRRADLDLFRFSLVDFGSEGGKTRCLSGPGVGSGSFFSITGSDSRLEDDQNEALPECEGT